jgi:hypothetical protein
MFLTTILIASFDNSDMGNEGSFNPNPQSSSAPSGDEGKTFTQEDLNRFLADDRRKTEAKFKDKVDTLESSYQEAINNNALSGEDRQELENQLEDLRARHRTKEQQLAFDKKQAEEASALKISELEARSSQWEARFTESTINRELQSAAVEHDSYNPELVVTHLKGSTSLTEKVDQDGRPTGQLAPMVTMTVKNEETGVMEALKMTPIEAVQYMKKNPERYGGFFKNNIREGIGGTSATGGGMSGDGTVDLTKISDAQYFKLRKENPSALGLKHLRNRR